ncbi:MAG: hypothetical protein JWN04_2449 [Myxococcaceae bacterium]|nr:hypothetical protein [Myxococcaceae bacterium]
MHTLRWMWVGTVWLLATGAQAQVTASDKATAEALFDRGITLLKEGRLEEACVRLEQSNAVEHGIGTMLYLAECYEKSGRTASAWALFREASSEAQAAGQVERAAAGRQRAERLEPTLSRLTVEVPEAHRVPGLEVSRNGTPIPKGLWGLPLPVDPGEQHIAVRASGYLPHEASVAIEKGPGSAKVTIPALAAAPVAEVSEAPMLTAPVQGLAAATSGAKPAPAPLSADTHGLSTQQLIGIITGGTGVALLAVGAGFGARANNLNGDAKEHGCRAGGCPTQKGVDLTDSAKTSAIVSDIGFIAGGALIAGGLATYFLAPKGDHQTKVAFSADPRSAVLHVGGVF